MKDRTIVVSFVIVAILAVFVTLYLLSNKDKTHNKGKEDKVEKGKTITLPQTTKEGFAFMGWYIGDELITENKTYDKDVTLKARWSAEEVTDIENNNDN